MTKLEASFQMNTFFRCCVMLPPDIANVGDDKWTQVSWIVFDLVHGSGQKAFASLQYQHLSGRRWQMADQNKFHHIVCKVFAFSKMTARTKVLRLSFGITVTACHCLPISSKCCPYAFPNVWFRTFIGILQGARFIDKTTYVNWW